MLSFDGLLFKNLQPIGVGTLVGALGTRVPGVAK